MKITLAPASPGDLDAPTGSVARGLAAASPQDAEDGRRAVAEVLQTLTAAVRPAPWGAYWALAAEDGRAVGLCAFKSAPLETGEVEIAYYTFPALEGRGIATAMAAALGVIAKAGRARRLAAKTLPAENASTAVLRRNGFAFAGSAEDPDDGRVWVWRKTLG